MVSGREMLRSRRAERGEVGPVLLRGDPLWAGVLRETSLSDDTAVLWIRIVISSQAGGEVSLGGGREFAHDPLSSFSPPSLPTMSTSPGKVASSSLMQDGDWVLVFLILILVGLGVPGTFR